MTLARRDAAEPARFEAAPIELFGQRIASSQLLGVTVDSLVADSVRLRIAMRPGVGRHFIGHGEVTRPGGRVGSTQTRPLNDAGTLIATAAAACVVASSAVSGGPQPRASTRRRASTICAGVGSDGVR